MVASTARRVREGLAELIRLANDPATATSDLRVLLAECKTFGGQLAVLQADTAVGVAAREQHGDSGVGVLAQAVGLPRRDAARQVKIAKQLQSLPSVRDAVESGDISIANARVLGGTSERTSTEEVEQDSELLRKAAALSPEQLAREAARWAAHRQEDDGEGLYRRQRARRRLSFWDGDDGMVHLRGELDPVTGAKVRKRLVQESERLRRAALRSTGGDKPSLNQRMADALDTLTSHGSIYARADRDTNDAHNANNDNHDRAAGGVGGGGGRSRSDNTKGGGVTVKGGTGDDVSDGGVGDGEAGFRGARCGCSRVSADITIVQHLSAEGTEALAQIDGGAVIPPSVLEEYFCNARITGVVFGSEGMPLWHGHAKRRATKAQMNALRARYGACGGCGANMWICDGHHIRPVSQGGPTNIDNLMLLCWACHQKVHHHGWREVPDGRGLYTIEPPERIRHGPAHAPDAPPTHGPSRGRRSLAKTGGA
ncbi:MAG: DUF222 domain-containing protein [Acidimicrobiia bacterium]|nr:DUF222 domain-containing protein [Acidimicrobiia bacterium]